MTTTLLPADFFVLRTPMLAWDVVQGWCEGLEAADALRRGNDVVQALRRDTAKLRERLRAIVRRPDVRAALCVASPSLASRLPAWLDSESAEAAADVEPAVVRYIMRMAGRATPFGLFAGCTFGRADDDSDLAVPGPDGCARHTRLNMDWLFAVALRLAQTPVHRPHLRYRANSTVYRRGTRVRFYSVHVDAAAKRNARAYRLCEIPWSPHLDMALAAARDAGCATIAQIADAILDAFDDVARTEAHDYVAGLVQAQLLWPQLLPAVTGDDPLPAMIEQLRAISGAGDAVSTFEQIRERVVALDAAGSTALGSLAEEIVRDARALAEDLDTTNLLRVDLRKPKVDIRLSRNVLRQIASAVELASTMARDVETPIDVFAREFEARYQGREVSLLEVLDSEAGIGFEHRSGVDSTALVKDLAFVPQEEPKARWGKREKMLLGKLSEALHAGAMSIELSKRDVAALATSTKPVPPPGQTAIISIAAKSHEALDRGDYRVLIAGGGHTTSAALLGRFLHDDPILAARARVAIRKEEAHDSDAIHAEIAHHVEGFSTNASCRPLLRDYEIDIAAGSGAPPTRQIPLDDLLVSVQGGKVILRSRTHGRRVVPHLSSAQAFFQPGLAVYRFLAYLQLQGVRHGIGWSWGPALADATFLPRVTHGNVVLALATWRLAPEELAEIAKLDEVARFSAIQNLRERVRLPRHVCLVNDDNVLPVDLENVLSIESLLSACKHLASIELCERFPGADELVVRGEGGAFHHELLVPLLRGLEEAPTVSRLTAVRSIEPTPDWSKRPGEDWLYAKLYGGTAGCDRLLHEVIAPLVHDLRAEGLVDRWFFIRYSDPRFHLRLRMHGDPAALWTAVAPRLFAVVSNARDCVHRLVVDTYDREVERYGGREAMEIAETIFEADSDAAVQIASRARGRTDARWKMAILGMHLMLEDLGFAPEESRAIVAEARDVWARRLGATADVSRHIGAKYRDHRKGIEAIFQGAAPEAAACAEALRQRSAVIRNAGARLRELARHGTLTLPLREVASSHLHMWNNRVLRGSANAHELVLYDFLERFYASTIARSRLCAIAPRAASARE